jgi:hypothetical protein
MAPKPEAADAVTPETPAAVAVGVDPNVIAMAKVIAEQMVNAQMELQRQQQEFQREQTERQIAANKDTVESATRKPENANPPLVSDLNPLGERDHPRPALPYTFTMNGAEMPEDKFTIEENALITQITPGQYRVTKTDDTQVIVSVVPVRDSTSGQITKMNILGPFGNKHNPEQAKNWPPLRVWLAEALGVPVPQRLVVRQPTGRVLAPLMGSAGSTNGIITGSLESQMGNLGPILGQVQAMLSRDADALEPVHG